MIEGKIALKVKDIESRLWFLVDTLDSRKAEDILNRAWDDWYDNEEDLTLDEFLEGRLIVHGIKYIATEE